MRSGSQQQGPAHSRGPCRSPPSSSSPSPSSSSASMQQQQQQVQNQNPQEQQQQQVHQQNLRQQQQFLRKAQGNEALLAFQTGGFQGIVSGKNVSVPPGLSQQQRNFMDFAQQAQSTSHSHEDGQSKSQNQMHAQAYLQYAFQAAQNKAHANLQSQQQGKAGLVGSPVPDQDLINNLKLQELMRFQAASQAQAAAFKRHTGQVVQMEKPMETGQTSSDRRSDLKPQQAQAPQLAANTGKPVQGIHNQHILQSFANNYANAAQLQALHAWAMEKNIDLSSPANAHLIPQILLQWQARVAAMQKATESNQAANQARMLPAKSTGQELAGSSNGSVVQGSPVIEGHSINRGFYPKPRPSVTSGALQLSAVPSSSNHNTVQIQHNSQGGDHQLDRTNNHSITTTGTVSIPYGTTSSHSGVTQAGEITATKNASVLPESLQMQYYRQLQSNRSLQSAGSSGGSNMNATATSQGNISVPVPFQHQQQQQYGFTKQQLHCLKSQILAFRRLKRGERTLPPEILQTLSPPPLYVQQPQQARPIQDPIPKEKTVDQNSMQPSRVSVPENYDKEQKFMSPMKHQNVIKEERDRKDSFTNEEKKTLSAPVQVKPVNEREHSSVTIPGKEENGLVKKEQEHDQASHVKSPISNDFTAEKSIIAVSKSPSDISVEGNKLSTCKSGQVTKDTNIVKRYRGPLFDVPPLGRNGNSALSLDYDVKDLLLEEGKEVFNRKRNEHLKKIERLLAVKLDRKRVRPDLVIKLQIEERKLHLLDLRARIRDEVDQQQQEIMAMADRPYRKFVRLCERQRAELVRQVQLSQKAIKERHLKAVFQWRKRLLETHWAIRDARTTRNRGVAKYHEKLLKEFSKKKDEDRTKRMEALKNNDVDRYRQMLLEQQNQFPGDAQERYMVLSTFLTQTEDYLHKLGGKITAAKNTQEVEEAAAAAANAARAQGLSEEEVAAAAACARQEVLTRNQFTEMNASRSNVSVNKYYNQAHAISEKIVRQPSMLRAGTLRDYQLVGLQWMLSLYNNKLNGILADEMGLGKTVQVMALIAYLMEFKGNYGPHLIIVPNAVMVNWKSELYNWLPTVSCIFYVGGKDQRNRLYSQVVCARKFNVLVTTYEFVMRDRAKLSRIDWKYIIIDEAQRMKDRESRLARDLDRFRCQRRLLLTGTPLQNDLQELWSLLNLLLPEVFDNRKAFQDWFSKPFQKETSNSQSPEDDWLETEKKVIIIHRLHQILEPFMLRRRVEDVEGSLPPKVSVVLRCRMSALQGAIYDWVKATGSIRLDPESEARRVEGNSKRQIRAYVPLQNRCMELRKVCNHPFLSYPFHMEYPDEYIVRSCGKLWILDRILIKLHQSGHRVLLFSTMTKLLDILEEYLQWRHLQYRRIDGTTSLEDRESAIHDFNKPGSECFLFLLSIRAAGRGLNLQSADTVVIYDPDPNPKNEEQAVARAHRIGQKREVKVIYMEAVVEKIPSYDKEDELRSGGMIDDEDELAGKDRYMGSVESLVRNNIQQYKIDMADEVINAGRFDQRTTQEERRMTLETLLHDEERYQETVHDVPSLHEVNRMIARSEEEMELFDRLDEELDWPGEMLKHHQIPKWLRVGSREVNAAIASMSKQALKKGLVAPIGTKEEEDRLCAMSPVSNMEKKSSESFGKPSKEPSSLKKQISNKPRSLPSSSGGYELVEASVDDKEGSSAREDIDDEEEEGEIREDLEEEENSQAANPDVSVQMPLVECQMECDGGGDEVTKTMEVLGTIPREHNIVEADSSESSFYNVKMIRGQMASPAISGQKFGSLAAIEAKPALPTKSMVEEIEEGEIVASGDSHMEFQQSESCPHEKEDGEEEQVLQPRTKRKRTMRTRPRLTSEKLDDKSNLEKRSIYSGIFYQQNLSQMNYDNGRQVAAVRDIGMTNDLNFEKSDHLAGNNRRMRTIHSKEDALIETLPSSKQRALLKHNRYNGYVESVQNNSEHPTERWETKPMYPGASSSSIKAGHMPILSQRKCREIFITLQRAINPPKKSEIGGYQRILLNPNEVRFIEQRLDHSEYGSVLEFAADVQAMLENATRQRDLSLEVKADLRRIQGQFLQHMARTFPDVDFSSFKTRSLVSIGRTPVSSVSPKQLSNQPRPYRSQEDVNVASDLPQSKHTSRVSNFADGETRENSNHREAISRIQKEPRISSDDRAQSREKGKGDEAVEVTHPGDLVICKRKRKDRDKVVIKSRLINSVADTSQASRPLSQKDVWHPGQARQAQAWPHFASVERSNASILDAEKDVQWAKPVRKLRTDAGKRRPSHI
eukprot:TRINITY_DN4386_c0_g3_i1.p1 TRINITY_DN4386_c0_g3~~TRINITY_DN4386_c0_g3_i1.p1  ORF type:complete len:2283 (-),score=553.97 TRINITY_DN4386_c0_g3_i1:18-6866(-)